MKVRDSLHFHWLNLSPPRVAQESSLNRDDAKRMAEVVRSGVVEKNQVAHLTGKNVGFVNMGRGCLEAIANLLQGN